ncbi:uncharacterized protein V1516DRAFT_628069 [Lipomyces oligophaga]|uniref:uncharacterized protein n=1 Tax=Lipomyces oligophaga TaxID=45792 RepID=UPI0034CDE996
MILFLLSVLLNIISGVQATSYSYDVLDVPVYHTPFDFPTHFYRVYPRRTSFEVAMVGNWGSLNDWYSQLYRRDNWISMRYAPVTFCPIGNQSFWFEGYTWVIDSGPFYTGLSIGKSSLHPNQSRDLSSSGQDPQYGMSALVANEEAVDGEASSTIHTGSFCVPISPTTSIQFWQSCISDEDECERRGSFLMVYTLKDDGTTLSLFRPQTIYSDYTTGHYEYGIFATMVVNQVIYLYAADYSSYSYSRDVLLARAPLATYSQKSTWTYWNNLKQRWSVIEPIADQRRDKTHAIYSLPEGDSFVGPSSVFYSEYHRAYLMIFLSSASGESSYIIEYAPTPVGPWSTNKQVLYNDPNYKAGLVTPTIFSTPLINAPSGKQLLLIGSDLKYGFGAVIQKLIFA